MAIFGNITERYNSYQLDYAINEMNNFCFVTEHVDISYLTEGFFSNLFEKIKTLWTKFKNWVKEKIQWVKDKLRSLFKKKKKESGPSPTRVMHDVDVDLTLETSYFVALDDVVSGFEAGDVSYSEEYKQIAEMTFEGEDYKTKISEKLEEIKGRVEERTKTMNKIKDELTESKNVNVKEVKIVAKRLSTFAGDLKEVNREIESETYELRRFSRLADNVTAEIQKHIREYDGLINNFNKDANKLEAGKEVERSTITFKTQVLNLDIGLNKIVLATFISTSSMILNCHKQNSNLLYILEALEMKAYGEGGIEQKDIDAKNLKNYCKLEDAKAGEEGKK